MSAARGYGVSLPERVTADDADETQSDERPKHQLVAEKTDEVWQQAKPFVCGAFALKRGQNWQIHEHAFWEQHADMGMREDMPRLSSWLCACCVEARPRTPEISAIDCSVAPRTLVVLCLLSVSCSSVPGSSAPWIVVDL